MCSKSINVIGIMSGTSLDGLDICLVSFNCDDYSDFNIINSETYNYSSDWTDKLSNAINLGLNELNKLDNEFGKLIGDNINKFILKIGNPKVDLVSSHGHTVFHDPKKGITKQIGKGSVIFDRTKISLICDFRTQDVELGGQGAPLVPIGDLNIFKNYKYCLNLGGFGNISIKKNKLIKAFDICPVNTVLNYYSKKLGYPYDKNGKFSEKGNVNYKLFNKLNSLEYYKTKGPKSLGIEFVNEKIIPLIDSFSINNNDILKTFIEHIAEQINISIIENKENESILITGGGTYNQTIIKKLKNKLKCNVIIPEKKIIDNKEALIFAYMGLLRFNNKINCLKSVTGASKDHSSGKLFKSL